MTGSGPGRGLTDELVDRAAALVQDDRRAVLGIAGPPAAGKSTLAAALVERVRAQGVAARLVPMDGFHLADVTLARLRRHDRKGAPDTFDGWGYAELLGRLRDERDHTVYAPGFARDLDQPVAGAIGVEPADRLVVTEGNYLLVDEPPWRAVRAQLDEVWFCGLEEATRRRRLQARHVRFGRTPSEAAAWIERVDDPNAALVATTRTRADLVVDLPAD